MPQHSYLAKLNIYLETNENEQFFYAPTIKLT